MYQHKRLCKKLLKADRILSGEEDERQFRQGKRRNYERDF